MRRSLLNKRILPKPLRQALVLITLLLLPSAAWGITKQYYLYGKDNNKVIGTTSDGSSTSYWTVSGSYDSFDASSDNDAGFTSTRTSNGSLTLTSEGNFYKIKSVTVDIGAGDWGSGQETSSFEISVNGVSPSNTSYSIDHQYTGSASNISTDFKVVTFTNPADSEEPVTIVVSVTGIVDIRIQSITVEYTENYGLTIGETALTSDNVGSDGTITGLTGVEGTVKFTPADEDTPATLTLKGATINGGIQMESSADNKALIINLDGENEITGGMISFSNSQYHGDLTFKGTGSLNIGGGEAIFDGVNSVNTSNGLYIATDFPNPYCQNGFYLSRLSSDNNVVTSATISTSVTYPIWVYKGDFSTGTGFTQVTDANKSNILGDDDVKLFYNNNILTLNGFTANTYYTGDNYTYFMTYIGNELENLTVNLASVSEIEGKGFYFEKENATLTFTTGETPGKLTISDNDNVVDSYQSTTVKYENELGNYFGEISVDWPRLVIGETKVTGNETDPIIVKDSENNTVSTGTISFNKETNTLSLTDNATIGTLGSVTDIFVYIKDLTVEISGSNTLYGRFWGEYEENDTKGTIFFKKASNEQETTSLTISGIVGGQGPITDFSKCTWGEDLYLTEAKNGTESLKGVYYNGSTFIDVTDSKVPDYVLISDQPASVSLWIGDTPVKTDNASNVFAGNTNLDGKVSVTFGDTNILTLDNADIQNYIIVSALPNLTIEFKSGCYWDKIISTNSNATLTFSLAEGAGGDEHDYLCCMPENSGMPWEGFSAAPTFNNNLCYLPNSDSQYITKLRTPQFNMSDGKLIIEKSGENLDQIHAFYSVDFVEGNDVDLKEYNSENPETIDKPCTVTAYTEFEDVFGVKRHSDTVTGKYFGFADKTIVFNNETKGSDLSLDNLEISPETEGEGIEFKFMSTDDTEGKVVSYDEQEKQWSIAGIGSCKVYVRIEHNEASIQVLNPENNIDSYIEISGNLYVLPDKPSIVKDAEHDYIETDKITITRTSIEGEVAENIKIFYIWSDDEVEVETYQYIAEGSSVSIYNPDEPIPAQTGTLRAWVGYQAGDNYYYNSEVVSEEFTVYDIAEMVWESESQTYGTYYNPDKDMAVPSGSTAYIVTGISEDGTKVTISPVSYIKAGVAVLIERDKTTEVSKTTDFSASKMAYSDPQNPAQPSATNKWYVIYNNKFVKVTAGTQVKGGKCYLNLNGTSSSTRSYYDINSSDGTTALREVKSEGVKGEKWADSAWHDLQGRKFTTKPTKPGLYILNGKKVVIK